MNAKIEDKTFDPKKAETFFAGIYAAALTPMRENFSCNDEELANHCHGLINRGCQGVVLFGTTGEGTSFSLEEREKTIKNVIKLGINPKRLIVGISFCAIDDVVKLASTAIEQACAAVLILPPFFYNGVNDAGIIAFYKEVIQKISDPHLKILLYHIPQYSGVFITLPIIKALQEEFPNNVIGIKESEGNLSLTKEILTAFPGFKVFVGSELQISEAVQMGALGGICGVANAYPELICSLYEFGKDQKKLNNNVWVQNMVKTLKNYPRIPALKTLLKKQKGVAWHVLRPPLTALNEKESQVLIEGVKEYEVAPKPTLS